VSGATIFAREHGSTPRRTARPQAATLFFFFSFHSSELSNVMHDTRQGVDEVLEATDKSSSFLSFFGVTAMRVLKLAR